VSGTAAYLGLAVLLSQPARVLLAIVAFVLAEAALCAGGNLSPGIREDRSALGVIGMAMGFCRPTQTDTDSGLLKVMRFADSAFVLFAGGGALRLWPVFVLCDRFQLSAGLWPFNRAYARYHGDATQAMRAYWPTRPRPA
jgi:hypothetical protein